MKTGEVDLTGVESTMLVTLFLRALDAKDTNPILGDRFAVEAVDRIKYDWTKVDKPNIGSRFDWFKNFLRVFRTEF